MHQKLWQRLKDQLQEKDRELNTIVAEINTLRRSYEELTADRAHLQHMMEQLMVEVKMKKELAESSDRFPSDDSYGSTVVQPQVRTCMCVTLYAIYYSTVLGCIFT